MGESRKCRYAKIIQMAIANMASANIKFGRAGHQTICGRWPPGLACRQMTPDLAIQTLGATPKKLQTNGSAMKTTFSFQKCVLI